MYMVLRNTILFIFILSFYPGISQDYDPQKINWMTWEEAIQQSKVEKRKIFVDLYTKWCTWCKKMETSTFQQEDIANFINERYYPVKFDAQFKESIEFQGEVYKFKNGYNELATKITMGSLKFPSVIFLDEDFNTIQSIPGFLNKDKLEMILIYFADDHHFSTPWSLFEKKYTRYKTLGIQPQAAQQVKGKN